LKEKNVPLAAVEKDHVRQFLLDTVVAQGGYPERGGRWQREHARAMYLFRFLRDEFAKDRPAKPLTPVQAEMAAFREHLGRRCGYSQSTILERIFYMEEFLTRFFGTGPVEIERMSGAQIVEQVAEQARIHQVGRANNLTSSVRSYMRFLQLRGIRVGHLLAVVPRVPRKHRLSTRPHVTDEQAHALLKVFDQSTPLGQRDYAMALCMLDLGMRGSDMAVMKLDDIDWRNGVICIPNHKTGKPYQLPLPERVGRAIARYLRKGRPQTELRTVFLRHRAPIGTLKNMAIPSAMHRAYARAGIPQFGHGCRALRRTVATRMLRRGVPLKEIADVLGHQSINTTVRYARLDPAALAKVAIPWPEGLR
jgi:integrase